MLKILTVPDPILRQKSSPVTKVDTKIQKFITDLAHTLMRTEHPKGVGLSAVQVGKLWRIFATYLPRKKPVIRMFINPVIVSASKKLTLGPDPKKPILEGCLSIPKIYGPVWRHEWIKLRWQALNTSDGGRMDSSEVRTAKFSDFPARVVQHEMDHLNGILFTDHSLTEKLPLYEETDAKLITLA